MTATLRTALSVAILLMPMAASADLFQYETEDGVLSFTDDATRVPARYGAIVEKRPDRSLADYERLSVSQPGASTAVAPSPLKPAVFAPLAPAQTLSAPKRNKLSVRIGDMIAIQVDPEDDEPIYVDRRRYITRHGIMAPHTVVSRGGTPLIYINDRP